MGFVNPTPLVYCVAEPGPQILMNRADLKVGPYELKVDPWEF